MILYDLPGRAEDFPAADEPGGPTTDQILQWVAPWKASPSPYPQPIRAGFSAEDDQEFRPSLRPPVPILTLLDDGLHHAGEDIRLRSEVFAIGRTTGDLRLPHDPAVSSAHAEIRRTPWQGGYQWTLHDVGSLNGTFARCTRAMLHDTAVVILGARRFHLRDPLHRRTARREQGETDAVIHADIPAVLCPALEEIVDRSDPRVVPLHGECVTFGRTGGGADVELDDPLLAYHHATLARQRDGSWLISAEHTRNGVWVSTLAVALSSQCHFRLGEQIFRFVLP